MTPDEPAGGSAAEELRGVRRIFLVALAAALVAAGVALGVELTHHRQETVASSPSLLPQTFREAGFSDGPLQLQQRMTVPAGQLRHDLHTAKTAGTIVYVVVRCDGGSATVRLGGLTSSAACSGRAVGLVRLTVANGGADLQVSVNRPQRKDWAIGIYR